MRILIAEDDTALAGFVRKGLEAEHYAVDVSADGEQARALATEFDYDLVVLDLNLLRLDGMTILKDVRSTESTVTHPDPHGTWPGGRSGSVPGQRCGRLPGEAVLVFGAVCADSGSPPAEPSSLGIGPAGGGSQA